MKLLHTSDWHLGARLGRHDRTSDQQDALRGLVEIAQDERPDLIVHAGDLFDAYRPPYPALRLGVRVLNRLAEVAPTLVVRGNHDSPELFRVIDELVGAGRSNRLRLVVDPGVVEYPEIADQPVAVACVPFVPTGAIVDYASDDQDRFEGNYADGIKTINRRLIGQAEKRVGPRGIVLYAAHLHLHGARPGNSERRLTVGEDYAAHPEGLQRALYCAFGHIHDPQIVPGGAARGRYAGSLVPLDFGEATQAKEAVVVEIGDDVRVRSAKLPSTGRPLRQFVGTLEQMEDEAQDGGWNGVVLKARVRSEHPVPDLADQLLRWSPKCAVFNLTNEVTSRRVKAIDPGEDDGDAAEPPMPELFAEWRASAATGAKAPDEIVNRLFADALDGAGQELGDLDFGADALEVRAQAVLDSLRAARRDG